MVHEELRSRGFIEETPLLYREIVERSGLFRVYSERIEFRHLLFQEFFAGRAITNTEHLDELVRHDWWKRAIVFYFGEHPNDIASLSRLAEQLDGMNGGDVFVTATTVGLALQACYFAHVDAKSEVYSRVIRSLVGTLRDEQFMKGLQEYPLFGLVWFALSAKDSLALSNLRLFIDRVESALLEIYRDDGQKQDEVRLWLILGLLESGLYDLVQDRIERFKPRDSTLLFLVRLELMMAREVRVVTPEARAQLLELEREVGNRLRPHTAALQAEFERESRRVIESMKQSATVASPESATAPAESPGSRSREEPIG